MVGCVGPSPRSPLWFAAGVAVVLLASLAVSVVGRQVTGSRPAPLSAGQVEDELASADATTTTTDPTGSTTTKTAPGATTTVSTVAGDPPATTPTTTARPPTTTTTVPPPAAAATSKTYNLVGGSATLRFSSSGVTVVAATPKAGYSVDVGDTHGNGVRVEFESDDHRSRVDAWWDGGPQDEVREED